MTNWLRKLLGIKTTPYQQLEAEVKCWEIINGDLIRAVDRIALMSNEPEITKLALEVLDRHKLYLKRR